MADLLQKLRAQAREHETVIALAEGEDPRIVEAAVRAQAEGLCRPLLIGRPAEIRRVADELGPTLDVPVLDPAADPDLDRFAADLETFAAERQLRIENPRALVADPLYYADLLVKHGRADGAVMGAVATTAETLRAALRTIGVDPRFEVVTSCFLIALPVGEVLVYADCGVIPDPTSAQLAEIAIQAADTYRLLVGGEPRVALLSFSTHGSARHPKVEKVRLAIEILRGRGVDFAFDGELQGDAALVPAVAARKAPGSPVAGQANVLIFPDLDSGNIAYKLTERLAGARALGPLLRGLDRPVHDLSRGCSVEDVLDLVAITAIEASRRRSTT